MQQNLSMNSLQCNCVVAELDWSVLHSLPHTESMIRNCCRGMSIPAAIPSPDVILAADCVYFEPAFPLLVQTLDALATEKTQVFFCYKKRV